MNLAASHTAEIPPAGAFGRKEVDFTGICPYEVGDVEGVALIRLTEASPCGIVSHIDLSQNVKTLYTLC